MRDILFVEAESFENHGGWVLDQQFMDQMGSPYLLAHDATPRKIYESHLDKLISLMKRGTGIPQGDGSQHDI